MAKAHDLIYLHASSVAYQGRAVVIEGHSGSGKSMLSLGLMALGARLVSDDQTCLTLCGDQVLAAPPQTLAGRIEARGLGILRADFVADVPVSLFVTCSELETDRLPPRRSKNLLGICFPMLHYVESPYFASAILQYLKGGRDA